jgi:phosphoribosylglycinamide formyltransferase-1
MLKVGFICSGGGGILKYTHRFFKEHPDLGVEVAAVWCDRPCGALHYAMENRLECLYTSRGFPLWAAQLLGFMQGHPEIDQWVTAFDRLLPKAFLDQWKKPILNVHFSLLPAFAGMNAMDRSIQSTAKFIGSTVHIIDEGMDTGPIVGQGIVVSRMLATAERVKHDVFLSACYNLINVLIRVADGSLKLGRESLFDEDAVYRFYPPLEDHTGLSSAYHELENYTWPR